MSWHVLGSLSKENYDKNYSDRQLIKRLTPYLFRQKSLLVLVVLFSLLTTFLSLMTPILFALGLDQLFLDSPQLNLLYLFTFGYLFLLVIEWIINYAYRINSAKLRSNIVYDLREDLFRRVNQHDLSFFDKNKTGKIMARISGDTFAMGGVLVTVVDLASVIVRACLILFTMMMIDVSLTISALLVFPLLFLIVFALRRVMRKYSLLKRRAEASINAAAEESINGISITKSFGQERSTISSFKELQDIKVAVNIKQATIFRSFQPLLEFLTAVSLFIILYVGGVATFEGLITPGLLFLFYSYLTRLFGPLIELSTFYATLQNGFAAGERMFSMMDVPTHMTSGSKQITHLEGEITIKNLTFRYDEATGNIFENLNLTIHKGKTVAIVGETGAGKTSLVSIISRMYEFQAGSIILDNKYNIKDLDTNSVQDHLGYVLQDPFLFTGTILDNMLLGAPDATEETVEKAITAVGANSFIDLLPERLLTPVRERGKGFSQGQKQLLALARVLIKNPQILILDEATSSVDVYTEKMIQDALELIFKDRTTLIIAHRLSTVINADRIIVLDKGTIVEDGCHQDLINNGGKYRELYEMYYAHQGMLVYH